MDGRVDRLRIICRAGPRTSTSALRLRRRLDTVARHHLPAALELALRLEGSVTIPALTVRLDFDPEEYDDVTLATLWANRVRGALVAELTSRSEGGSEGPPQVPHPSVASQPSSPTDASGRLLFLSIRVLSGDRDAVIALAHAVLGDPAGASAALASWFSPSEQSRLLGRLAAVAQGAAGADALRRIELRGPPSEVSEPPMERNELIPEPMARSRWADQLEELSDAVMERPSRVDVGRSVQTGGRDRDVSMEAVQLSAEGVPLPSRLTGLVLLWPWLAGYLDEAGDGRGNANPSAPRRLALAALVRDVEAVGGVEALEDPVIRLLAGEDPASESPPLAFTDEDVAELAVPAAAVLEAFAATLPGFEDSTEPFIRQEFLVRDGVVDPTGSTVVVRLAPKPLDLVLSRLPYPLGPMRLPWTADIAVVLEES